MTVLNYGQQKAADMIKHWYLHEERKIFVLSGYAGTGKTFLIRHVVCDVLGLVPGNTVEFVTPTGKAATVLIKNGTNASTIHHLIYKPYEDYVEVRVNGKTEVVKKLKFRKKDSIDSRIKLIVLDEASMVSDQQIRDLTTYGPKILVCGDGAQLPPIEATSTILKHPDCTLTTIVRQEEDNPIVRLSKTVREGGKIDAGDYGTVKVLEKDSLTQREYREILLSADQIISGHNETRQKINAEMRSFLGRRGLPQGGEKLLCTYNNWEEYIDRDDRFNLVNGLIGTAGLVDYDTDQAIGFMYFTPDFLDARSPYRIPFDMGFFTRGDYLYGKDDYFRSVLAKNLRTEDGPFKVSRFEFGYCVTCHKAQGSEYDRVVLIDETDTVKCEKDKWLYTAITRAKKELVILR
ncbi:MAG: AAA family ATPase [Clostridia bacterium]|nr:AAA family ATPase [Clostridia bacterium]